MYTSVNILYHYDLSITYKILDFLEISGQMATVRRQYIYIYQYMYNTNVNRYHCRMKNSRSLEVKKV